MSTLPSFCCCGAGGPTQFATVLAYHARYGWANFTAPFRDKYLHRLETTTYTQITSGSPPNVQVSKAEYLMDKLTGAVTVIQSTSPAPNNPFPFGSPPSPSDPAWVVQDTYYSNTATGPIEFGTITIKKEVLLSSPYTLAAMDADAQALLDSIPMSALTFSIPGTITPVSYDSFGGVATGEATFDKDIYGHSIVDGSINIAPRHFFPPSVFVPNSPNWNYSAEPILFTPPPLGGIELYSAAGFVYVPKERPTAFAGYDQPCGYAKWQSYVKANTKFCKKYFFFTLDQAPVAQSPSCESGVAVFTTPVKITTSPLTGGANPLAIGTNLYVMFTPNCQCP